MRVVQPAGYRGSLKWIQKAVNQASKRAIDSLILSKLGTAAEITWCSPLATDDFAEYRDVAFLEKIGEPQLAAALAEFWPPRGPQWDALGRTDRGDVLLVEGKAHIGELCSPGSQAREASREMIQASLRTVSAHLGAQPRAPWIDVFYQLANRIAHLHFLRAKDVRAWLVLANFVGDREMDGPENAAEWEAAYEVVWHVLGLRKNHPLARYIIHIYPKVAAPDRRHCLAN